MGWQDRIRESITGGSGGSDPPEYSCNSCHGRFNSNQSPRHASCPDCDSGDVELLANPDSAEGSHPLDPRSDDDPTDADDAAAAPDAEATASTDDEASAAEFEWAGDGEADGPDDGVADRSGDEAASETDDGAVNGTDDEAASETGDGAANGTDDDEAAVVRELMATGQYRCQDCREAFDQDGPDLVCPDCGSTDIEERF